jgi:hypothetical protein
MTGFGLVVALLVLASCGGGGGSTGPSNFAGTYVGTANITLTSPGGSQQVTGSIQFDIAPDGTVTVSDPGQPPYGTGALSGNTFVVTAPGSSLNSPGVSCTGTITFEGTVGGAMMNGTISSSGLRCNNVPFTLTGTFTATLQTQVPTRPTGGGVIQWLKDAVGSR